MPTIETEVVVYCTCGQLLKADTFRSNNIEVEPCEKCLEKKREEGIEEGTNG